MEKDNKKSGLPDLEKVIEQARRLKDCGVEGVGIIVRNDGLKLTIDEPSYLNAGVSGDATLKAELQSEGLNV